MAVEEMWKGKTRPPSTGKCQVRRTLDHHFTPSLPLPPFFSSRLLPFLC